MYISSKICHIIVFFSRRAPACNETACMQLVCRPAASSLVRVLRNEAVCLALLCTLIVVMLLLQVCQELISASVSNDWNGLHEAVGKPNLMLTNLGLGVLWTISHLFIERIGYNTC